MDCVTCDHERTCEILGVCMHSHDIIQGDEQFKKQLKGTPHNNRLKFVLRHMKRQQPAKVSDNQMWKSRMQDIYDKFECHREPPVI